MINKQYSVACIFREGRAGRWPQGGDGGSTCKIVLSENRERAYLGGPVDTASHVPLPIVESRMTRIRLYLALSVLSCSAAVQTAEGQIGRRPVVAPKINTIATPDVPLLIGMNSGHAVQVDDMTGAAAQVVGSGFFLHPTSAAPVLGRGPNGQLISLVPGGRPRVQVLLANPDWQDLDSRLGNLVSFTFDPTGSVLYGVSCEHGTVVRYEMASRNLQFVGSKGTGVGQLSCPEKIALDAQGRIYVADITRVVRMNDITGNGWTSFGSGGSGTGQFGYIRGLAVDRKGRIYVSDNPNRRIVRFDDMNGSGWTQHSKWITTPPENIAVDAYDRLYVALPVSNQVLRLDDISGENTKTFAVPRDGAYGGPKNIVPMRRTGGSGTVIR